jgi:hypothetical protein
MTPEEQAAADKAAAEKKITFTEEQQTAINTLINQRFAKVSEKHEAEKKALADEKAALQAQLEEVKAGKHKKEGEEDPKEKQYKDLLTNEKAQTAAAKQALEKESNEKKSLAAENLRIRKEIAIREAAQNRFLDMEVVMAMVQDKIEYDDDTKNFVVREGGIVRQNASLQNMSLSEYFDDFGKKRPFLVRSDVVGGAGSSENAGGAGPSVGVVRVKADLKSYKDKSAYITKFGLDAYEKLPLK